MAIFIVDMGSEEEPFLSNQFFIIHKYLILKLMPSTEFTLCKFCLKCQIK